MHKEMQKKKYYITDFLSWNKKNQNPSEVQPSAFHKAFPSLLSNICHFSIYVALMLYSTSVEGIS